MGLLLGVYVFVYYNLVKVLLCGGIGNLWGCMVVVIGVNSGIGKMMVLELVCWGVCVVLVCCSWECGEVVVFDFCQESGNNEVIFMVLDLVNLVFVWVFVIVFLSFELWLDIFIYNVGISFCGWICEVFNLLFWVNYIGFFLLIYLLLFCLKVCVFSCVVVVVLVVYCWGCFDFKCLDCLVVGWWQELWVYVDIKLVNVLFVWEFVNQFEGIGIICYVVYLGFVNLELFLCYVFGWLCLFLCLLVWLVFWVLRGGVQIFLYCVL